MNADELSTSVQLMEIEDSSSSSKENINTSNTEKSESTVEEIIRNESKHVLPPGYQLSYCLAEGCVGRVFLIINPETKDCLAAKVVDVYQHSRNMSGAYDDVAAGKLRFELRQEAELIRKLKHRNIASVYGVRNTPSFGFMFMELIAGGELFERIPVGVGLQVQQMFVYYSEILDALRYLHDEQHIAHLDVKPENIMLNTKDRAKLIDFGWAVDLQKSPVINGPVGTQSYAAPEVFSNACYSGPPADLFSLGVTLLTAVTGQRCWSQANPKLDTVYLQWTNKRGLHSGPVFSRLPPDLANFLTRALAHDPAERLTVDGILAHPWYRRGVAGHLTPVTAPTTDISAGKSGDGDHSSTVASVQVDAPVPSSQPIPSCASQVDATNIISLSQPVDTSSMFLASQTICSTEDPKETDRLRFSSLIRRITRFFSSLPTLEHTVEVLLAVLIRRRQIRSTVRGPDNLLVDVRNQDHTFAVFRILLYPLAGSILVDCRRTSGDGLLFHQTYAALYADLVVMGVVNENHPYLQMVRPEQQKKTEEDNCTSTESTA